MKKTLLTLLVVSTILTTYTPAFAGPLFKKIISKEAKSELPGARIAALGKFLKELNLSAEQKKQIATILNGYTGQVKGGVDNLLNSATSLSNTIQADQFDEQAIRAAHKAAAAQSEELIVVRAKILHDIRGVLSPEQNAKVNSLRANALNNALGTIDFGRSLLRNWIQNNI